LSVAEENDALDLARDRGADSRDGTGHDSGALAIECVS
jgi:hypothetical protein